MDKPFQADVFLTSISKYLHLILCIRKKNSHEHKCPCLSFLFINKCRSQSCLNHQMILVECTLQFRNLLIYGKLSFLIIWGPVCGAVGSRGRLASGNLGVRIPAANRSKSWKQAVAAQLLNAQEYVWVSRVTTDDHYKRIIRVTLGVA